MGNGYATPSANQLSETLNAKYGWTTDSEKALHQSFIGSSVVVGMAVGAFCAGKLIQSGRRRAMLLTTYLGVLGVSLIMIENFYVLLLGRVIFGFTAGSQACIVVRMIDEYVPQSIQSTCMGVFCATQNFSAFIALCSGFILPKDTN